MTLASIPTRVDQLLVLLSFLSSRFPLSFYLSVLPTCRALERSVMLRRLLMLGRESNGENLASSTPTSTQDWPSHITI
jgi:hypothetical protein